MKTFSVLFSVLLCTACASIVEHRRTAFIDTHPGITQEERDAILHGEIRPGFDTDMVIASWGRPQDVIQEIFNDKEVTSWIYQRNTYDYIKIYRIRFLNQRVNEVKLIKLIRRASYYYPYYNRFWQHGYGYEPGPPFFGFPPYGYPGYQGITDFSGTDTHYNADPYYDPW